MKELKRFESYVKLESGKYHFVGWYPINENDEQFCIEIKTRVIKGITHLYKKYKYTNGEIEEMKFIISE